MIVAVYSALVLHPSVSFRSVKVNNYEISHAIDLERSSTSAMHYCSRYAEEGSTFNGRTNSAEVPLNMVNYRLLRMASSMMSAYLGFANPLLSAHE